MHNSAKKLRIWPRATWQNLSQAPINPNQHTWAPPPVFCRALCAAAVGVEKVESRPQVSLPKRCLIVFITHYSLIHLWHVARFSFAIGHLHILASPADWAANHRPRSRNGTFNVPVNIPGGLNPPPNNSRWDTSIGSPASSRSRRHHAAG